jgi:hypothetical protein
VDGGDLNVYLQGCFALLNVLYKYEDLQNLKAKKLIMYSAVYID